MLNLTRDETIKTLRRSYNATEERWRLQFQRLSTTTLTSRGMYTARCAIGCMIPNDIRFDKTGWDQAVVPVSELIRHGIITVDDYPWFCQLQAVHDTLFRAVQDCRLRRGATPGDLPPDWIEDLNAKHQAFVQILGIEPTFDLVRLANIPLTET